MQIINEAGRIYGKLTVLCRYEVNQSAKAQWLCRCECGKEEVVYGQCLRRGRKSCLECSRPAHGPNFKNMKGKKFGRLTVIDFDHAFNGRSKWKCSCDCNGNIKSYLGESLRSGNTKSCGCIVHDFSMEHGVAAKNKVFLKYKHHAYNRKYEFNLSFDDFIEICSKSCFYCGISPFQVSQSAPSTGIFIYNGIDRVNNALGYSKENCVPCCGPCNQMKMDDDIPVFTERIKAIYHHFARQMPTISDYF